jgi:L-seryl-tRNA(Ser) seleniumtransferase
MGTLGFAPYIGAARTAAPRDVAAELGVRTFLNAAGTYTALTASLMSPEVMAAMTTVSRRFMNLNELQDAVGAKIAQLLECEAAMVTSGAAGALTIGTAGCLTGKDPAKIKRLPDLTGMKSEVLIQRSHRYVYDHAVRACGVRLVEVETAEEFLRAANEKTAMALYLNDEAPRSRISREEFVALGKRTGVPTFNDAAADTPPVDHLKAYTRMGFDLVAFSGGKNLCGPQSSGLLLGRKDLIEAARLNTSPNADTIARGMKVNKEEMVGMLVALDAYLRRDHEAEAREWNRRIETIIKAVEKVPTVTHSIEVPAIANHTPHLKLKWDQSKVRLTPEEAVERLRAGKPSIEVVPLTTHHIDMRNVLAVTVWMLQLGEAEIVGKRIAEVLREAVG